MAGSAREREIGDHEADVPAKSPPARQDARLSAADENQRWPEGVEAAAGQGAQTTGGLRGRFSRHERLSSGADFQALFQQGKRIERSSLIVLWRNLDAPSRVGFAVSRQVRGAVRRNRVRRRLREAYRAIRESAPSGAAFVIIGRPVVLDVDFKALMSELRKALESIPRTVRSS